MFSDAYGELHNGLLGYRGGILFWHLHQNSTFHPLIYSSIKSNRPVKSVGGAEILAAGEAINEVKLL